MRTLIAAIYVDAGGCYSNLPGVDPWPSDRDGRREAQDGDSECYTRALPRHFDRHGTIRKPKEHTMTTPALSTILANSADTLDARALCNDTLGPREMVKLAQCMRIWAQRARDQETPQAVMAATRAAEWLKRAGIDTATH